LSSEFHHTPSVETSLDAADTECPRHIVFLSKAWASFCPGREFPVRAIASVRTAIIAITFAGTLRADYRFVAVNYPGQPGTVLTAINATGLIAGDAYNASSTLQVVFFTDTRSNIGPSFQYPGAAYTQSSGIDNAGDVVGQYIDFAHGVAYLRSAAGVFTSLPLPVPFPLSLFPSGQAISGNGAIVLSASNDPHLFFRAANGSYTSVVVPGVSTAVTGIDNAGNVVGVYVTAPQSFISFFRDANGVFQTIQVPGAMSTQVAGMNNLGQAVGTYFDNGRAGHGFLWRGGSDFTLIDYPGASSTFASGINDSGVIVGSYIGGATIYRHGMIVLPGGFVSPVPAPPSLWLAVTGCLAVGGFWFLRRRVHDIKVVHIRLLRGADPHKR